MALRDDCWCVLAGGWKEWMMMLVAMLRWSWDGGQQREKNRQTRPTPFKVRRNRGWILAGTQTPVDVLDALCNHTAAPPVTAEAPADAARDPPWKHRGAGPRRGAEVGLEWVSVTGSAAP